MNISQLSVGGEPTATFRGFCKFTNYDLENNP